MAKKDMLSGQDVIATARRIVREVLADHWKLFLLSLVCMIGVAGFTGALAYSTRLIVNDVFVAENVSSAYWVAALVIGVSIGKAGFEYANAVISVLFDRSISAEYQKKLFRVQLSKDVPNFIKSHPATFMAQIKLYGQSTAKTVVNICNKLLTDTLTLIALFTVMILQDPIMTLFSSLLIPVIFLLVSGLSKRVRAVAAQENELAGAYFALGAEAFEGIKTVKSYRLEGKSIKRFEHAVDKLEERLFGIAKVTSATVPVMELLGGVVIGLFVMYAAWQTISEGKTPGEFTAFITAFLLAYQPAERVSKVWVELQKTLVQVNKMFEILDEAPSTPVTATASLDKVAPSIRFDAVGFSYSKKGTAALEDVSFDIKAGEKIAIVGRSGAGKSTLIDLLQRFYPPSSGRIEIGGVDLSEADEDSVRRSFALISQDVFLFDDSIRSNILDGKPDATEDEVTAAAGAALVSDFAQQKATGLDSRVGPNGRTLSGGQRQRVGIARALAKRAKIYVFDESTSALDSHNERLIMTALGEALRGSTLLFVTHRASTLAYVDRVLVMEGGQVVAFDTPDRLLQDNPEYQALFEES